MNRNRYWNTYAYPKEGVFTKLVENNIPEVYESYQEDYAAALDREAILRRFANGDREIYMELKKRGVDGAYHWICVNVIYVENPVNDDVLAIDLIKILDAQRMEQARQEQLLRDALASAQAANRAKSDFLSRMSHDIRTPMNAIIGMSAIGKVERGLREGRMFDIAMIDWKMPGIDGIETARQAHPQAGRLRSNDYYDYSL